MVKGKKVCRGITTTTAVYRGRTQWKGMPSRACNNLWESSIHNHAEDEQATTDNTIYGSAIYVSRNFSDKNERHKRLEKGKIGRREKEKERQGEGKGFFGEMWGKQIPHATLKGKTRGKWKGCWWWWRLLKFRCRVSAAFGCCHHLTFLCIIAK